MVIAERTTSYGFLAPYQCKTNSNSTTGRTDLSESSVLLPIKKIIQIMHSKMQH
jgi:hypothetical protein